MTDTSGEKKPLVSVGITRLVLMFRQTSNIQFEPKKSYKMVASKGVGRQLRRGFSTLAQGIGRTAIPFLRKFFVPAAKRIGADLLDFPAPEIAEVVSGGKIFKTAAKSVGRQTLRKQLGSGSIKRTATSVNPTKSATQNSRSWRDIFTNISQ